MLNIKPQSFAQQTTSTLLLFYKLLNKGIMKNKQDGD